MKPVGIVVEYNPFHNGHALHLRESKEKTGADIVIAVMSGNFLQRGEPALVPKWERTKMALNGGVDIIVELPYPFATQKADTFAFGAVKILDALGVKWLVFGSESGNIEEFNKTINFLDEKKDEYNQYIQEHIGKGVSYPKALALAYTQLLPPEKTVDLSQPNNILGIQYVKAIQKINSSMEGLTIERKSAQYHDVHFRNEGTIASATSIRKAIFSNEQDWSKEISSFVPKTTLEILKQYKEQFHQFHDWEMYWPFLQYRLLQASPDELREIYEVEEGIEHRLIQGAAESKNYSEFMGKVKTKRYTWTRIQRICVHILVNVKKTHMLKQCSGPNYIRLLGMTQSGRKYLQLNKKTIPLPIVSKLSSYKHDDINLDIQAAKIYALGSTEKSKLLKMEYAQPPILLNAHRH